VKTPNNIADTIPNIDDIYIYLGNEDPFFVFSDRNRFIMAYDNSIDNNILKNELNQIEESRNYDYYFSMREVYGIESDIYVPYEMNTTMPVVYVDNVIGTLEENAKRQVAERFFDRDIDYIREIVESNGSTIYVLNNRSLK